MSQNGLYAKGNGINAKDNGKLGTANEIESGPYVWQNAIVSGLIGFTTGLIKGEIFVFGGENEGRVKYETSFVFRGSSKIIRNFVIQGWF